MAPNQHTSDTQASVLAWAGTGPLSSAGLANILRIFTIAATPTKTKISLIQKSGLIARVVASAQNSPTPVNRLTPKPHHMTGYSLSSGLIGDDLGHRPRNAKLMSVAPPATIAMPSVCAKRNIGKAQSDPDSRTHWLKNNVSSHS